MTTFERRQRILNLLQQQSSVKVVELTKILGVSEGTIRNDLTALDEAQQLVRVHGGAILKDDYTDHTPAIRTRPSHPPQQWIARQAVDMIDDGDAILLDASSIALLMTPFLQERHNLTIVTNGLEVARALAENPANTTILIGGVIRTDGAAVTGHLGTRLLQDLRVKTAFVSCTGFSLEAGLTERDIQEAQLKSQMIRAAKRVIGLIESRRFDNDSLAPFATLNDVSHILTDNKIEPHFIKQLRQTDTTLVVCGEKTVSSLLPFDTTLNRYKIGFANLSEDIPFAVEVRRGLERAVQEVGNIDLIAADNQLDGQAALHVAERLIAKEVDLVVEFQIDQTVGSVIMNKFQQANIPVIAVDIPMVGANYFGADNYHSGNLAGTALGNWLLKHWDGYFDRLFVLEEHRPGSLPAARIQGQLDGLQDVVGEIPQARVTYIDSGGTTEISERRMGEALQNHPGPAKFAVISFNDDVALGTLLAARKLKREGEVIIVGQGADKEIRPLIRRDDSRIVGSTAFMPEKYGEQLVEMALRILKGKPVPPATYINHTFIDIENIDEFYPQETFDQVEATHHS